MRILKQKPVYKFVTKLSDFNKTKKKEAVKSGQFSVNSRSQ